MYQNLSATSHFHCCKADINTYILLGFYVCYLFLSEQITGCHCFAFGQSVHQSVKISPKLLINFYISPPPDKRWSQNCSQKILFEYFQLLQTRYADICLWGSAYYTYSNLELQVDSKIVWLYVVTSFLTDSGYFLVFNFYI